jgi:hypothetical protein
MKFEKGDQIYDAHVDTTGHEFYVATGNFMLFQQYRTMINKSGEKSLKAACYQAYAEFVRGLYEYYVAVINWNEGKTSLPKNDVDAAMNDAAQRLMNFYQLVINTKQHMENMVVPEEFGKHFRQVRNRISHADYRRMGPRYGQSEITLAQFYEKYHYYVKLMLEHPQFTWGGKHFMSSYKWEPIEDFIATINKSQVAK